MSDGWVALWAWLGFAVAVGLGASAWLLRSTRDRWRGQQVVAREALGYRTGAPRPALTTRPASVSRLVVGMVLWVAFTSVVMVPVGTVLAAWLIEYRPEALVAHGRFVVLPVTISATLLVMRVSSAAAALAKNTLPYARARSVAWHLRLQHALGCVVALPLLPDRGLGIVAVAVALVVCVPGLWLAKRLREVALEQWVESDRPDEG